VVAQNEAKIKRFLEAAMDEGHPKRQ